VNHYAIDQIFIHNGIVKLPVAPAPRGQSGLEVLSAALRSFCAAELRAHLSEGEQLSPHVLEELSHTAAARLGTTVTLHGFVDKTAAQSVRFFLVVRDGHALVASGYITFRVQVPGRIRRWLVNTAPRLIRPVAVAIH
jgi:predicted thioesterase